MGSKLVTTPRRILAACFIGYLTAWLFTAALLRLADPRALAAPMLIASSAAASAVWSMMASLGWIVCHVLRARLPVATAAGAALAAVAFSFGMNNRTVPITLTASIGFGLATALVWWVAYPRKLQALAKAELFA